MVKGLGYGLIVLSCWGLAEQAVGRLKIHRRRLKQLQSWLSCFQGKLIYEGAAAEEALRESAELAGAPFSVCLEQVADELMVRDGRTLPQIWQEKIALFRRQMDFSAEEFADLLRLGGQLGQMDREVQLRAMTVYSDQLGEAIKTADGEIAVKERLYRSLGLLAGCFILILIW